MARPVIALYQFSRRRFSDSLRIFFFFPTALALFSSLTIFFYISSTSSLFARPHHLRLQPPPPPPPFSFRGSRNVSRRPPVSPKKADVLQVARSSSADCGGNGGRGRSTQILQLQPNGNFVNNEVFHDRDIFLEDYKAMKRGFKIYVYPHRRDHPFANALLPVTFEPGGNYASESYFKKVLMKSHFTTKDPYKADLFFLPFSIARLRHDDRVGVGGIQDFIRDYIFNISQKYPYWNRTGGADHFYAACHSIGRSAMEKADAVRFNAIQVVCSASYFLSGYIPHKDACLPQIWPRQENPSNLDSSKRTKLAFFAGSINSPVRERLLQVWANDSEIVVHFGRLNTSYADELLNSKFCLHVKGFEVNTARIADSIYYGCVPLIIANHYDLPFADILNWKSFSVVVATLDIPLLKSILKSISSQEYKTLRENVLKIRKHFRWNTPPVDYDAFYMVMYELWLRRSSIPPLLLGTSSAHSQ
uniref:Exostosin GT47 domain-containing protein n=3 Tax=Kalanchoe fedtschenkoi TaxID=63787 RepID=A0A7N0VMT3_KALFE